MCVRMWFWFCSISFWLLLVNVLVWFVEVWVMVVCCGLIVWVSLVKNRLLMLVSVMSVMNRN